MNFAFGNAAVKDVIQRAVGNHHRIVGRKLLGPVEGIPADGDRRAAEHERAKKRKARLP